MRPGEPGRPKRCLYIPEKPVKRCSVISFCTGNKRRFGVGGANKPPPGAGPHPHTVDHIHIIRAVRRKHMIANPVHHREFLGIRAINSKLWCGVLRWQRIHECGDRLSALDHLRDNPCRGVDGVIKPEIAVTNEDVARHFAGQRRAKFLHPLLHVAVPGLPDPCRCAGLLDQAKRGL